MPYLNFAEEKLLRNIIVHPDGLKSSRKNSVNDSQTVFAGLSYEALANIGESIGAWLDAVCEAFNVSRFMETEAAVKSFARNLGCMTDSGEV